MENIDINPIAIYNNAIAELQNKLDIYIRSIALLKEAKERLRDEYPNI